MRDLFAGLLLVAALPALAQEFTRGDVIVVSLGSAGVVRVYGNDGAFKRELFRTGVILTEPLVRDGVVYVASRIPASILRITSAGATSQFAGPAFNVNYLAPGPEGGLLATNGSGEIYQFARTGELVQFRDVTAFPPAFGGIDLAPDQCTVFFAGSGSLARWNACTNTGAAYLGPSLAAASGALRLLPDGTFLTTVIGLFPGFEHRVIHVNANGNVLRAYAVPGEALALDPDGVSFWTNAGNYLLRIDIATGTLISQTFTDQEILGLATVGEPRAGFAVAATAVPAIDPRLLPLLLLLLVGVALYRVR